MWTVPCNDTSEIDRDKGIIIGLAVTSRMPKWLFSRRVIGSVGVYAFIFCGVQLERRAEDADNYLDLCEQANFKVAHVVYIYGGLEGFRRHVTNLNNLYIRGLKIELSRSYIHNKEDKE